ncbi:MAG: transposase [Rhodobacteraceae bacterium]|nr:transposase [Paracoccaceae bacterium]
MNTDQESQFTSFAWTDRLCRSGVRISPLGRFYRAKSPAGLWMDGKGRFLDNNFVERLWHSLKYECVYLHARETGSEAKVGVGKWGEFYNRKRPQFRPWRQTSGRGLLAEKRRNPTRSAGAESSLSYAESCPTIGE